MNTREFKELVIKENKTEQEFCAIINEYEKTHPHICGTDTLAKFLVWYDKNKLTKL